MGKMDMIVMVRPRPEYFGDSQNKFFHDEEGPQQIYGYAVTRIGSPFRYCQLLSQTELGVRLDVV